MARKRGQPLAKTKYDKSHPIISIRFTPDLKEKLKDIKIMSDGSPADVLKKAVGLQIHSTCNPYDKGYLLAEIRYCVTYKCSVCGRAITISTPDEKKAVAQYMESHGWGHSTCLK